MSAQTFRCADYIDASRLPIPGIVDGDMNVLRFKERISDFLSSAVRSLSGDIHPTAVIDGPVIVEPGARVGPYVIVEGPAYICAGANLRGACLVRDSSIVGPESKIGFGTEIIRSLVMSGASALHHAIVADSIIGNDAVLGGGTMCAVMKVTESRPPENNVFIRVGDHRVDTGYTKFGSVIGDRTRTAAQTILNPGTLLGPDSLVIPGSSVGGRAYPAGTRLG